MTNGKLGDLAYRVDSYVAELFAPPDPALENALRRSREAGQPEIHIPSTEGRLLQLLAEISGARRILEIGTLGGYSAIHLARGLPENGKVISLEINESHAKVARENIEDASLTDKVEVRVGDAHELLAGIVERGEGPFDLIFIDVDKQGYLEYLEWSLKLFTLGSLILADNVIWGGSVLDPGDDSARAIHEFNEALSRDTRLSAHVLPLVKGSVDGIAIARVLEL